MNVVSAHKATVDRCSYCFDSNLDAFATFSIRTYIFEAVTKLAQLHKRLQKPLTSESHSRTYVREWLLPFSARIQAEFLSRFFRAVSCRKSDRADICVRLRRKFEEFFRTM